MGRLSRRIREREAAIDADRRNIATAVALLRIGARRRAASPSALGAAFGGGLLAGWLTGGRASSRARRAPARESPHRKSRIGRFAREVLWPLGVSVLRVQLGRLLLDGGDPQRR